MDLKKINTENVKETAGEALAYVNKHKKVIIITSVIVILILVVALTSVIILKDMEKKKAQEFNLQSIKPVIEELGYKEKSLLEIISKAEVASILGVLEKDIESYIVRPAGTRNKAHMYMVIKPNSKSFEIVKKAIEEYIENYDLLWKEYLKDQYELVKKKAYGNKDGYIYLFITENSYEVEKEVRKLLR